MQLVDEAQKLNKMELKQLFGIGLRNPARKEITKILIQKELADRALR